MPTDSSSSSPTCLLACGGGDGSVLICDLRIGASVQTLLSHQAGVWSLCWHTRRSHELFSACAEGKMKAWDVRRGDRVLYEFNHLIPDVEFLEAHRSSFYEACSSSSSPPFKDRQEGDDPLFDALPSLPPHGSLHENESSKDRQEKKIFSSSSFSLSSSSALFDPSSSPLRSADSLFQNSLPSLDELHEASQPSSSSTLSSSSSSPSSSCFPNLPVKQERDVDGRPPPSSLHLHRVQPSSSSSFSLSLEDDTIPKQIKQEDLPRIESRHSHFLSSPSSSSFSSSLPSSSFHSSSSRRPLLSEEEPTQRRKDSSSSWSLPLPLFDSSRPDDISSSSSLSSFSSSYDRLPSHTQSQPHETVNPRRHLSSSSSFSNDTKSRKIKKDIPAERTALLSSSSSCYSDLSIQRRSSQSHPSPRMHPSPPVRTARQGTSSSSSKKRGFLLPYMPALERIYRPLLVSEEKNEKVGRCKGEESQSELKRKKEAKEEVFPPLRPQPSSTGSKLSAGPDSRRSSMSAKRRRAGAAGEEEEETGKKGEEGFLLKKKQKRRKEKMENEGESGGDVAGMTKRQHEEKKRETHETEKKKNNERDSSTSSSSPLSTAENRKMRKAEEDEEKKTKQKKKKGEEEKNEEDKDGLGSLMSMYGSYMRRQREQREKQGEKGLSNNRKGRSPLHTRGLRNEETPFSSSSSFLSSPRRSVKPVAQDFPSREIAKGNESENDTKKKKKKTRRENERKEEEEENSFSSSIIGESAEATMKRITGGGASYSHVRRKLGRYTLSFPSSSSSSSSFSTPCWAHESGVTDLASDGLYVLSSSLDGRLRLWNADTGAHCFVYYDLVKPLSSSSSSSAFSEGGRERRSLRSQRNDVQPPLTAERRRRRLRGTRRRDEEEEVSTRGRDISHSSSSSSFSPFPLSSSLTPGPSSSLGGGDLNTSLNDPLRVIEDEIEDPRSARRQIPRRRRGGSEGEFDDGGNIPRLNLSTRALSSRGHYHPGVYTPHGTSYVATRVPSCHLFNRASSALLHRNQFSLSGSGRFVLHGSGEEIRVFEVLTGACQS
ncbi:wd g-beta repeat-containing protein, partial [Cystoisospora suis]